MPAFEAIAEQPLGYTAGPLTPASPSVFPDSPLLHAYKKRIFADASSTLVFRGPANVAVSWSLTYGLGELEPLSNSTNDQGVASAIYRPLGALGFAVVRVSHGV